jgi:nucleoporin POM152
MSSTPRLRSGFPATPTTTQRRRAPPQGTPSTVGSRYSASGSVSKSPTLPLAPENQPPGNGSEPVIPFTLLDAPQQRLYAFGIYVVLWAWKLYDWLQVVEDGDTSWGLFLKWILIDFVFLFGLPELRIPWLEFSQFVVVSVFSFHLISNYMLMFNIPVSQRLFFQLRISKLTWNLASLAGLASRLCKSPLRSRAFHLRT